MARPLPTATGKVYDWMICRSASSATEYWEVPVPHRATFTVRTLGAAAALALSLIALTACTPPPSPTSSSVTPSATVTPASSPTQAPTPTPATTPAPAPTPAPPPQPQDIVLSAAGVGSVVMGTANPQAALEALLGPGEQVWNNVECGPGNLDAYQWGALSVNTADGALWGWHIQPKGGALPAHVVVASGVTPYQPLSDALALPGATAPQYMASIDMLYVEASGVSYFGDGSDPASSAIQLVGVNVPICD